MMDDGSMPNLTISKSYDIVCSTQNESGGVDLLIIDDKYQHHIFELDTKGASVDTLDHFTMLGDYKDVWEDV